MSSSGPSPGPATASASVSLFTARATITLRPASWVRLIQSTHIDWWVMSSHFGQSSNVGSPTALGLGLLAWLYDCTALTTSWRIRSPHGLASAGFPLSTSRGFKSSDQFACVDWSRPSACEALAARTRGLHAGSAGRSAPTSGPPYTSLPAKPKFESGWVCRSKKPLIVAPSGGVTSVAGGKASGAGVASSPPPSGMHFHVSTGVWAPPQLCSARAPTAARGNSARTVRVVDDMDPPQSTSFTDSENSRNPGSRVLLPLSRHVSPKKQYVNRGAGRGTSRYGCAPTPAPATRRFERNGKPTTRSARGATKPSHVAFTSSPLTRDEAGRSLASARGARASSTETCRPRYQLAE